MQKARFTQGPQLSQKASITPRLQQALKVLNMPLQELTQFISQEFEQNPFLMFEDEDEITDGAEDPEALDPASEWNEPEADLDREDTTVDIDWETAFEDRVSLSERVNSSAADVDEPPPDTPYESSLHDYLLEQLDLLPSNIIASETERAVAEHILGNLNDDGKLVLKLFEIPREFLTTLNLGELSAELHDTIQQGLQTADGSSQINFSKTSAIVKKEPIPHPASENESAFVKCAWHINDTADNKTYTIKYEQTPYSYNPVLNFYQLTLEDIAETVGCETALVETVLREIQDNFEPVGIAHRDMSEALSIQIRNQRPEAIQEIAEDLAEYGNSVSEQHSVQSIAQEIVEKHFDALLNKEWRRIAEVLNVDLNVIEAVVKWIGQLSPYPGRYFTDPATQSLGRSSRAEAVTPDVEVQYLNGKYQVIAADSHVRRLRLNHPYYLDLMRNRQHTLDAEAKDWIEKRYRDALNLISSLIQRGSTIARVTEAIFEVQTDFLTEGAKSIKPLTLRTIAEKIGVHESTVSRVTSNKYVQTPQGMYPLRFFFSNELKTTTTQGEGMSAKQAKNLIQEMIDGEAPTKPLSDQAISNAFEAKGVRLARRTVQKYRDELGIPTSRERSAARASAGAN